MISLEEIKNYLPMYLSSESQGVLFKELKSFPDNIDSRFYTSALDDTDIYYQGDGVSDLIVVKLPELEARPLSSIILSNTCDISPENKRLFASNVLYAPIFKLSKYKAAIHEMHVKDGDLTDDKLDAHIETIKKQYITQILYLPEGPGLGEDSIVFLDRINNCPINTIDSPLSGKKRLFTLSDYGFYLFLFKLSVHFTRVREKVERPISWN